VQYMEQFQTTPLASEWVIGARKGAPGQKTLSDSHGRDFTTPGLELRWHGARTMQKSGRNLSIIPQRPVNDNKQVS